MLSKAQNKYIRSLTQQKSRNEYKVFVAEGEKIAGEWLASDARVEMIVAVDEWADTHYTEISRHPEATLHIVRDYELVSLSSLQTPNGVLLVVHMPEEKTAPVLTGWNLALDDIQDPGNMGTIIRIADWFGIQTVISSPGCVDVYNPKVVQSAMGSHLRVNLCRAELVPLLATSALPKYAATLDGDSVYDIHRGEEGIIIIGNESKGISGNVMAVASRKVRIPGKGGADSLNAGVSVGILCALLLPC